MSQAPAVSKPAISSFAEPTAEDLATFDSLPVDEQRALILAELAKTDDGDTRPLTPERAERLLARGLERAGRHEAD